MKTRDVAPPINELVARARLLRSIRAASSCFATLAALEHPALPDADEQALADPDNHNWSLLYRGSVLDD